MNELTPHIKKILHQKKEKVIKLYYLYKDKLEKFKSNELLKLIIKYIEENFLCKEEEENEVPHYTFIPVLKGKILDQILIDYDIEDETDFDFNFFILCLNYDLRLINKKIKDYPPIFRFNPVFNLGDDVIGKNDKFVLGKNYYFDVLEKYDGSDSYVVEKEDIKDEMISSTGNSLSLDSIKDNIDNLG